METLSSICVFILWFTKLYYNLQWLWGDVGLDDKTYLEEILRNKVYTGRHMTLYEHFIKTIKVSRKGTQGSKALSRENNTFSLTLVLSLSAFTYINHYVLNALTIPNFSSSC